jgi:hypothetical protein
MLLVFRKSKRVELFTIELQIRAYGSAKTLCQTLLECNICWNDTIALVDQENTFR